MANSYADTLLSIKKLLERYQKDFVSCENNSLFVSIILFLHKLKRKEIPKILEIIDKYLLFIFELNDQLMIENLVLSVIAFNKLNLLNLLVDKNFDFASFSKDGRNLLHHAVLCGSTNLIERLIELKVDYNALDEAGKRPFDMVSEVNQAKMKTLVENLTSTASTQRLVDHGLFLQEINKEVIASVLNDQAFDDLINPSKPS